LVLVAVPSYRYLAIVPAVFALHSAVVLLTGRIP
jgi:hypothetical protein